MDSQSDMRRSEEFKLRRLLAAYMVIRSKTGFGTKLEGSDTILLERPYLSKTAV